MEMIHGFKSLAHPLSQLEAAATVWSNARAYVKDMWSDIYKDPPPDMDEVDEWLMPFEVLGQLAGLKLRFEYAGTDPEEVEKFGEDFWCRKIGWAATSLLFHGWLFELKDSLEIDSRVIDAGFEHTDLVLIPDPDGLAGQALQLQLTADGAGSDLHKRAKKEEAATLKKFRPESEWRGTTSDTKGEGPREGSDSVLADKIAIALRDGDGPLSAAELAAKIGVENVPSVNATLHQILKGSPKRLKGWIRSAQGKFEWRGDTKV